MLNQRSYSKKKHYSCSRITFVKIVIFFCLTLIIVRLFSLQVVNSGFYKTMASGLHEFYQDVSPRRGEIYIHNHDLNLGQQKKDYPIATNVELNLLYAVPNTIIDPAATLEKLNTVLNLTPEDQEIILQRLKKEDDIYEPIQHYLNNQQKDDIQALNLEGLHFISETKRYYPENDLFSQVVGFVGHDDDKILGRYGLEEKFEKELAGQQGTIEAEKDALGQMIALGSQSIQQVKNGMSLVLTLDYPIQHFVCNQLKEAVEHYGAKSGSIIIMQPQTGKILAMCNEPSFNPNEYNQVDDINVYINSAVSKIFEPGSVFKAITMAIGLETQKITPDDTYQDTGEVKIAGYTIKNSDLKAHGQKTMTEVLEESLNTGSVHVALKVGPHSMRQYIQDFGFGESTGIELPSEGMGNTSRLDEEKDIYTATISFGQGISVTPIQMLNSFSTIANGGKMMQPYLVEKIINPDQTEIINEPKFVRQVISPATANTLKGMLVSVIENGHAEKAGVEGYYLAGKTGTAQVPDPNRGGYSNKTIHTFVGFGPADDPQFAVLIKLDEPTNVKYAASSTAPVFGQIAKFLLNYLQIPINK
ncbi:MAG: penicillin-binding protein 2 [Patescibacteria group bacterium]|nr:penicillin-binding protein 2 [Patescibacteria group bacterium]